MVYHFFADQPDDAPTSYQGMLARRAAIAKAIAAQATQPAPATVGEGLTAVGRAIGERDREDELNTLEQQYSGARQAGAARAAALSPPAEAPAEAPAAAPPAEAPAPEASVPDTGGRDAVVAAAMDRVPLPPPRPVYDRNAQVAELERDPSLGMRLQTIVQGEVGHNAPAQRRQVQAEEIMNRAAARGQPLAQVMQEYTGPNSGGYYPASTFQNGRIRNQAEYDAFQRDILDPVLRGSNVGDQALGFAPTGNASGGVAQRGIASGRYNAAGRLPGDAETYVQQETPAQLKRLAGTKLAALTPSINDAGTSPLVVPDIQRAPPPPAGQQVTQNRIPAPGTPVAEPARPPVARTPQADLGLFNLDRPPQLGIPSPDERKAQAQYYRWKALGDPDMAGVWADKYQEFKTRREQQDKQAMDLWTAKKEQYAAQQAAERTRPGTELANRKLAQELDDAAEVAKYGVTSAQQIAAIAKQAENVGQPANAALAVRKAQELANQMHAGLGANIAVDLTRIRKAMGFPVSPGDEQSMSANQQFQAVLAPIIGSMRSSIIGPGAQSNYELQALQNAVANNPNLDKASILAILKNLENINVEQARGLHRSLQNFGRGEEGRIQQIYNSPYAVDMSKVVPDSVVQALRQSAQGSNRDAVMQSFDKHYFTPGLAEEILKSSR